MKNYIDLMNELNERINALEKDAAGNEKQINDIIDADTIKERYENRKNNKDIITKLCKDLDDIKMEITTLQLAKKIAIEMYAKQAANRFVKAVKDGTKNLIDTPDHYKKFKTAAAAAVAENDAIIHSNYYTVKLSFAYYSIIGYYEITVLYTDAAGIITNKDAEKATYYELLPVENIEKTARDAIKAAAQIETIKKETAAQIDTIKEPFKKLHCVTID